MKKHVLRAIRADNPWLTGEDPGEWFSRFLPARYIPRKLRLQADGAICLVVGPRQAGKSTLIWHTLAGMKEPVLLLNCEEMAIREWLRSPAGFLADLQEMSILPGALLFEEIQWLPEAALFLKGVADRRPPFAVFATGSSSFDLASKTRESLAGRARRHLLLPLSLAELKAVATGSSGAEQPGRHQLLERTAVFGGYPQVVPAADPERELAGLVEALVVRDASDRFRIRHLAAFRRLLELMASQAGNLCNFSEWSSITGISNETVAEYARLVEECHLVRLVRPFVGGKRAELKSTPKVYFVDNGIRNLLFGGLAPLDQRGDRGLLIENLVFSELLKVINPLLDGLHFWRSKSGAEVDFVINHHGRLLACEVKAGTVRQRLSRSARSFIDTYRPERFLVVHAGEPGDSSAGATRIRFLDVFDLGREVEDFLGC